MICMPSCYHNHHRGPHFNPLLPCLAFASSKDCIDNLTLPASLPSATRPWWCLKDAVHLQHFAFIAPSQANPSNTAPPSNFGGRRSMPENSTLQPLLHLISHFVFFLQPSYFPPSLSPPFPHAKEGTAGSGRVLPPFAIRIVEKGHASTHD